MSFGGSPQLIAPPAAPPPPMPMTAPTSLKPPKKAGIPTFVGAAEFAGPQQTGQRSLVGGAQQPLGG